MSKTYLVTGGAGFIGSHFCEALLARGDSVVVLDDLSSGKRSNLAAARGNFRQSRAERRHPGVDEHDIVGSDPQQVEDTPHIAFGHFQRLAELVARLVKDRKSVV